MVHVVNMHEAKSSLSKLVVLVSSGEEVVIARAGVPAAKLVPVYEEQKSFRVGSLAHLLPDISDEEWDEMDAEFRAQFTDDELIS